MRTRRFSGDNYRQLPWACEQPRFASGALPFPLQRALRSGSLGVPHQYGRTASPSSRWCWRSSPIDATTGTTLRVRADAYTQYALRSWALNVGLLLGRFQAVLISPVGVVGSITEDNILGNTCGLRNNSGSVTDAANNFWGDAFGPGPDPADQICDEAGSVTNWQPPATTIFQINTQ